jgi:hypothetical protein
LVELTWIKAIPEAEHWTAEEEILVQPDPA